MEQHGKLVIVTGGTGHVGSAIVETFRAHGWQVASLSKSGSGNDSYRCDITNEQSVKEVVDAIVASRGVPQACVHAAVAPVSAVPLLSETDIAFEDQFAVTVRGARYFAQACMPHMKRDAAFIGITTKLIESKTALPPMGSYLAAKYGLRGFLHTLAQESKPIGVRVYAVAPGYLSGGLNKGTPPKILDMFAAKTGAGKSTREEIARLVYTLATDPESYSSGTSITSPEGDATPL